MADFTREQNGVADTHPHNAHNPIADISRDAHNSSPMPGVARNNDPALDIAKEHDHAHVHHGAHAGAAHHDNIVYTTGTTHNEPSIIPAVDHHDDALHRRHIHGEHDIEKTGGLYGEEKTGGIYGEEKVSMSKGRSSSDPDLVEEDTKRHYVSDFYKKFRLGFHILIGSIFTA
jgi:CNT family concentrative nucleoside transporter